MALAKKVDPPSDHPMHDVKQPRLFGVEGMGPASPSRYSREVMT